ncbi:MAG: calcium/sodium antiporter [Porticoccaceae bacterium]|nr:calcium/sodium antiporter [Porticoccaceae bacterium]
MVLAAIAIVIGLALLVWSADRFVDGAAATANHLGMSPLLIGMVIIGFGTSAPEMVVSAFAALDGNPGLALGNAYGSNIANIALILGVVALIKPISVDSAFLRKELPVLTVITVLAGLLLVDLYLSRWDAAVLGLVFAVSMGWSIYSGLKAKGDPYAKEVAQEAVAHAMPLGKALFWLSLGLILLIASSRLLVWGAVSVAQFMGISDLVIGLTVVAIGTSLPELASALAAVRKNEHDMALGNVVGSNIFNTLAVVGIAAGIHPLEVDPLVLYRDWLLMTVLTLALFVFGYGFWAQGRINRYEGAILLSVYVAYTAYLVSTMVRA